MLFQLRDMDVDQMGPTGNHNNLTLEVVASIVFRLANDDEESLLTWLIEHPSPDNTVTGGLVSTAAFRALLLLTDREGPGLWFRVEVCLYFVLLGRPPSRSFTRGKENVPA